MMFIFKILISILLGGMIAMIYSRIFAREAKNGLDDFKGFIKYSARRVLAVALIFGLFCVIVGVKLSLLILSAFILTHMFFLYRFSWSYF